MAADDDDGDAVPNGTEDGAPNGGDGNGDGIPDRVQGHVTSLPTATAAAYMTLEACRDMACLQTCQVRNTRALAEGALPQEDPAHDFPFGLLEFALNCSAANVRVLYHGSDGFTPSIDYIKFGPNPPGVPPSRFYELPGVVFGVDVVGADSAVASARFTLTDGAIGDDTGIDGTIFDQGGPALPQPPQSAPSLSTVGKAAALLVLLLIAAFAFRRSTSARVWTKRGA